MRLEDVSRDQIYLLASIFHHPSFESIISYGERIQAVFPQLDGSLLRPDFLHRLVQLPQSFYTPLCGLHRSLNAKAVHAAFVLVATEVGVRLNSLVVAGRDKLGHETWDCSILNLRSLHGAWLSPDLLEKTFGMSLKVPRGGHANVDYMTKWVKEEDGCEACILGRIGGDIHTVFDLHMVVSARTPRKSPRRHRAPRLLRLCEGWLKMWEPCFGPEQWKAKLAWNEMRAARLKGVKKDIIRRKREEKKARSGRLHRNESSASTTDKQSRPGDRLRRGESTTSRHEKPYEETIQVYMTPPKEQEEFRQQSYDSDGEEDEVEHVVNDAENEIIDCYAALISTPFLPGMGAKEHQKSASVLSLLSPTPQNKESSQQTSNHTAKANLTRSQSTRQRPPSNYSESVYSEHPSNQAATAYTPPRQQWTSTPGRSQSVRSRRASDRSWLTASIPTSTTSTASAPKARKRPSPPRDRYSTTFSAIPEDLDGETSVRTPHVHSPPARDSTRSHAGNLLDLARQLREPTPSPSPHRPRDTARTDATSFTDIWRGVGLPVTADVDEGDAAYRALQAEHARKRRRKDSKRK